MLSGAASARTSGHPIGDPRHTCYEWGMLLGVATETPGTADDFATAIGRRPAVRQWYQAWSGEPPFESGRASAVRDRGALPVVTWEPWEPGGGVRQPRYALRTIAGGEHDDYVARFARQVREFGGPVGLRVLHELNAPFYPWGAPVNGNSPADAVAAWLHLRAVFRAEGACDVIWIWCVNAPTPGDVPYDELYPGDTAVDWVALDGYNGGVDLPWGGWRTPEQLFADPVRRLRRLSGRPLALTEVASAEGGGDKAEWIGQLFAFAGGAGLHAVIWFDERKEADWRASSSPAAGAAMRRAAAALPP
jgi:hypothetical protein